MNFKFTVFLIPLLLSSIQAALLSAQSLESQAYEQLYNEASTCLNSSNDACAKLFEASTDYLRKLPNDSLAAERLRELGAMRMRGQRWDAQTKNLFDQSLIRSKLSGMACVQMRSQFALAQHARFLNISDSLLIHAERALQTSLACGDSTLQARAEVYLGSAYLNLSNYPEALTHFQLAESLYETLNDRSGLGGLYLDMAILYSEMHQKSVARNYTLQAAEIFKATGEDMKYGVALVDLSSDLIDVKLVDSALYYLRIAEPIVTETNLRSAGYMEQNYGTAYYLKGDYEKAIEHYHKGLVLCEKIGNQHLIILLHNMISECYLMMSNHSMAFRYASMSDSISASSPRNFLRTKAMYALARAAHKHERYDESYKAFMEYIILTDSLFSAEKQREIAALEQVYEAEKKKKEIEFQKQENVLLIQANKAAQNRNYALFACLLLIIVVAYAFISKQRLNIRGQQATLQVKQLQNENLNQEIAYKARELTTKALHIARKNELIQSLHNQLKSINKENFNKELNGVVNQLKITQNQDGHWDTLMEQFVELNPKFHERFNKTYPDLSKSDLRLAALLRIGFGSKDIASMLNISETGIKKARYRLRKKMNLSADESLEAEVMKY